MEENRNINNTSETGIVEDSQQHKQEENWKEEMAKDWNNLKQELLDDPDCPKTKTGRIIYFSCCGLL